MNYKYKKYIEYIAKDIQVPYLKSLEPYGLKDDEIDLVLGIVFNQPVHYIEPMSGVYNKDKVSIYSETSNGYWIKQEYDNNGNLIYKEDADGYWIKYDYDNDGNQLYREDAVGYWEKYEYNEQGKRIYYENSSGFIMDNR
jgi:YD repeat-containing protein